jgi:hypothetical protein
MTVSQDRMGRIFYQTRNEISSITCLIFDIGENPDECGVLQKAQSSQVINTSNPNKSIVANKPTTSIAPPVHGISQPLGSWGERLIG